jgi:transposase
MNAEVRNEIIRRWYGGESIRRLAREVQVARKTVRAVLEQHVAERQHGVGLPELTTRSARRASKLDAHVDTISALLRRYPKISVRRILEELRQRGYQGGYSILCERVGQMRGPTQTAWIERFETGPGVQAQMDYGVYTLDFTQEGRRRVNLFSLILAYSRRQYLRFVESQDMETTLRQHELAFKHLGGVAATGLYDNMKVVVSRYEDGQPIYNPRFLAFATHYGFRPVACRPRRPQTKGKIERPFQYVESSLLGGREFRSLEHLNEVTAWWLENVADVRVHGQTRRRPVDLHAEELPHLIPLPERPYEVAEVVYRTVDEEGFIRYGHNRYSVPWSATRPGQVLPVKITEDTVIIYGPHIAELARHPRFPATVTYQKSELAAHRPPRDQHRRREQLQQRYAQLGQGAVAFMAGLLQTQRNGWQQAEKVLGLLTTYRQADLVAALERAVRYGAYSLSAIERILAVQAQPKSCLEQLADEAAEQLSDALRNPATPPRPPATYQTLLFPETSNHDRTPQDTPPAEGQQEDQLGSANPDEPKPGGDGASDDGASDDGASDDETRQLDGGPGA